MSKNNGSGTTMLELWRPPKGAGEPLGCLATTYTFHPGLFDEQCLARFLEIESEPNREDLAFLLERETRLGDKYAGVMVDHSQAGVEHSFRWDILPVRIPNHRIQHAKLSVLVWANVIRIIVASANLTEPGYRTNQEVAAHVDLNKDNFNSDLFEETLLFLNSLLEFVPGNSASKTRASDFLETIRKHTRIWKNINRKESIRQILVYTLPSHDQKNPSYSSLNSAFLQCRARGESPHEVWVASPFYDIMDEGGRVISELCKKMTRILERTIWLAVPSAGEEDAKTVKISAPKNLITIPEKYGCKVSVELLPATDNDKNGRPWHAKLLMFVSDSYFGLMAGSSNFTCAGMGIDSSFNSEANILTLVNREDYSREITELRRIWPAMIRVKEPDQAEWLGSKPEADDGYQPTTFDLPYGFLCATYRAGDQRYIILQFNPEKLPEKWSVSSEGNIPKPVLDSAGWKNNGSPSLISLNWSDAQPPVKLIVSWEDKSAFWPLNVENPADLAPPSILDKMSSEDMILIIAATDPSAAFRVWAKKHQSGEEPDDEMDSATPIDLDPLRRYDLQATFLHRIRHRAKILAQLRANLQKTVYSKQALEWRLRGIIGIEALADRLINEYDSTESEKEEALLAIADLLIVLQEVQYHPENGSLSKHEFDKIYRSFIAGLADKIGSKVATPEKGWSAGLDNFWKRVLKRCQA